VTFQARVIDRSIGALFAAIGRSRVAILGIAATYAISIRVGVVMVSSGSRRALIVATRSRMRRCRAP
jgi:hypothetical protein